MIEYKFKYTVSHFINGYRHYKKQIKYRFLLYVFYLSIMLLFSSIAVLSYYKDEIALVYFFGALTFIPFWGSLIENYILRRKLKKSPFYNNIVSVKINEEGLKNSDNHASLELAWSAITKAREFPDGYMLFTGPNVYYWLPDIALEVGEKDLLNKLIDKNIQDYKNV